MLLLVLLKAMNALRFFACRKIIIITWLKQIFFFKKYLLFLPKHSKANWLCFLLLQYQGFIVILRFLVAFSHFSTCFWRFTPCYSVYGNIYLAGFWHLFFIHICLLKMLYQCLLNAFFNLKK